jgi:hypothetical protein
MTPRRQGMIAGQRVLAAAASVFSSLIREDRGVERGLTVRRALPFLVVVAVLMTAFLALGCDKESPPATTATAASPTTEGGSAASGLQFDGVYQLKSTLDSGGDYSTYLRFFPDGRVLSVSAMGTPEDAYEWSNGDARGFSTGTYEVTNGRLTFSVTSDAGTVDYEGTVEDGAVALESYSHINENRAQETFHFVQVPAE